LVMAGQVRVAGQVCLKSSQGVVESAAITIDWGPRFVSRGGEKLAAALLAFDLDVINLVCADVGASTGGFTDCLLQNGAARVYCIDVGKGILHWKLRQDPRVRVMEDTNARYLECLPEAVDLVTIDAAFISLRILLPVIKGWFDCQREGELGITGQVVALVKPQFEAGRALARRAAGVIRDPQAHRQIVREVLEFSQEAGFVLQGLIRSPLLGPKGNAEFLAWLKLQSAQGENRLDLESFLSPLFD
jgi:23S rRNA (cytidine1920-2'-O)/16S rRNA (cytidine1409-2'-O)-methyltransferase